LPEPSDIASSLRKWFYECPVLTANSKFSVDYLGERAAEHAIYLVTTGISSDTDILGNVYLNSIQEQDFIFASKEAYGHEVLQNLQNLGFFDEIISWMLKQNTAKNFPKIAEGEVLSVLPTTTPGILTADANTARYQIQCNLKYRRRSE
jgi:hypothetical protein